MEISLIFKIAAVGILVSIFCQILKHSGRDEQAFLVSLAGLLMVLFWIVPYFMNCLRVSRNYFCYDQSLDCVNLSDKRVFVGQCYC